MTTQAQNDPRPILVLGATGKTGRRVVRRLNERGIPVRAGSRAADPPFDWDQPATWRPALAGTRGVYITYQPDFALPGAIEAVGTFAQLAAASSVERLVLLSGRGEPEAEAAERAVLDAGLDTTIIRSSWFAQNFNEGFLLDLVLAGEVALPVDGVGEPFVDIEDIADVAAAALLGDSHGGRIYDVTGPRLLTFADAVAEIARASGRDVRFTEISIDEFAAGMTAAGLPADVVAVTRNVFSETLDGRNAHVGRGLYEATGGLARDFRAYAADAAATGVWGAQ